MSQHINQKNSTVWIQPPATGWTQPSPIVQKPKFLGKMIEFLLGEYHEISFETLLPDNIQIIQ